MGCCTNMRQPIAKHSEYHGKGIFQLISPKFSLSQVRPQINKHKKSRKPLIFQGFQPFVIACVRGFEPPTFWSVAKRSIQLS